MKKLIFFLILVNLLTISYAQENKFFVELRNYRNDVTYDKISFYQNKGDTIKRWNKYENLYIDYNNSCYSTKSFNANDTLYLSLYPESNTNKYCLFFGSMEVKNSIEPFIYDKMDTIKIGYSMVRENSYINGYVYKIEIDPDLYSTYNKRFYIIFKRIKHD